MVLGFDCRQEASWEWPELGTESSDSLKKENRRRQLCDTSVKPGHPLISTCLKIVAPRTSA